MRALAAAVLLTLVLAGCSSKGGDGGDDGLVDDSEFAGLDATETTGLIRGVVVDDAIRPLAGVTITLAQTGQNATTSDAGAFGFDGLEPGTYFLQASLAGYNTTQASADVVAGVAEPPLVRILLVADPTSEPFMEVLSWEGFIQCSVRFFINAVAACAAVPGSDDDFSIRYEPDAAPDWAQSEMVWESTQALGNGLKVQYTDDSDGLDNYAIAVGQSPLVIFANGTTLQQKGIVDETGLYIRVFAGSVEGTQMPVCLPVGLCEGASVVVNQAFKVYTVMFYNMVPPEGWQFGRDGLPPLP